MADLGVQPHHLRMLELVDEREGVPDGWQQHVAARLVGLGLDGEAEAVSLLDHVSGQDVERLLVAVERGADILRCSRFGALAPSPEDHDPGAQLGGEIEVGQNLAECEAAHITVIGREGTVAKDRVREQIGGHHGDHQPRRLDRLTQTRNRVTLLSRSGRERKDIVVVEADPVRAQLGQPVHRQHRIQGFAHRATKDIDALPADCPEPERETVFGARLQHDLSPRRPLGRRRNVQDTDTDGGSTNCELQIRIIRLTAPESKHLALGTPGFIGGSSGPRKEARRSAGGGRRPLAAPDCHVDLSGRVSGRCGR